MCQDIIQDYYENTGYDAIWWRSIRWGHDAENSGVIKAVDMEIARHYIDIVLDIQISIQLWAFQGRYKGH